MTSCMVTGWRHQRIQAGIGTAAPLRYSDRMRTLHNMLVLLALAVLIWLFHLYARTLDDALILGCWLVATVGIATGLIWRRRLRRRAFLSVYVAGGSVLLHWLRGGWILVLGQTLLAMLLAAFLLLALTREEHQSVWFFLIAAAPSLALLSQGLAYVARRHVNALYLPEFSLRTSVIVLGLLLLGALLTLAMRSSYPDFRAVSLERAVWHLVQQEQARSTLLLPLLQGAAAAEALQLWLGQQLLPAVRLPLLQGIGWVLLLVQEVVFVWSYLMLSQGILVGLGRHPQILQEHQG